MKLRRSKALHETVEINITAFLNLMVILVPFLLITAVFSRMSVLELTLPALDGVEQERSEHEPISLQLQLVIYPDQLEIRDANLGRIRHFAVEDGAINWRQVVEVLVEIKRRYPQERAISLLLDSAVPYRTLIETMDHVATTELVHMGTLEHVELFPDIAVGDAPPMMDADGEDVALDALPPAEDPGEQSDAQQIEGGSAP